MDGAECGGGKTAIHADIRWGASLRTLVDIPELDVGALDELSRGRGPSRAAVIRTAIEDYLARHLAGHLEDAFGLWADRPVDGLAHKREPRGEW